MKFTAEIGEHAELMIKRIKKLSDLRVLGCEKTLKNILCALCGEIFSVKIFQ